VGTFGINTDVLNQSQIRVVAFVWLQNLLESLGFGGKFAWVAPPLAVIVILIALQITSGKQWRFWLGDILPMAVECILLAVPLIALYFLLSSLAGSEGTVSWLDSSGIQTQIEPLPSCSSVAGSGRYQAALRLQAAVYCHRVPKLVALSRVKHYWQISLLE